MGRSCEGSPGRFAAESDVGENECDNHSKEENLIGVRHHWSEIRGHEVR